MTEPTKKARNIKLLPLVCLVISMGLLIVGLWPFRFRPPNQVHRIDGRPGLRFDKYGIAYGIEPLFAHGGAVDLARPFTIRMDILPRTEPSDYLARILSAYDAHGRELFFLGQWRDNLILQILKEERYFHLQYRETGTKGLRKDVTRSIVVRSDIENLTLYVDGTSVKTRPGFAFSSLSENRGQAWLILGNSPSGDSPWHGDLLSLSFYTLALSPGGVESPKLTPVVRYDFSEGSGAVCRGGVDPRHDLFIPASFRAPKEGILAPPWKIQKFNRSFWKDVFVNILGFIPFGFALYAWLRKCGKRNNAVVMSVALLVGAGISLFIELLQVYLPSRVSSLADVLNNVLGTWIGALLFRSAGDLILSKDFCGIEGGRDSR